MTFHGIQVDSWSLTSLQIEMYFNDTVASHGTGSIWRKNGRTFLVTNWHNFTGKHRETGEHISPTNCEPNKVRVHFLKQGCEGLWVQHCYDLFHSDEQPVWCEHPRKEAKIDLAALEITLPLQAQVYCPNELLTTPLLTEVGADLFVIGYPFKIDTIGLPLWKRASLASEFSVSQLGGTGRFFVDTATRQGMSGSIVIRKETGAWNDENGNTMNNGTVAHRLMGVYSGRLGANKDGDAQLGIVWPALLVDELLDSAVKPA